MKSSVAIFAIIALCGFWPVSSEALAAGTDWPTHHYDNQRSAVSPMQLPDKLYLQWTHESPHEPMPAWPEPFREFNRMPFDYAYQMVSADGLVLYGSSADGKLYALDTGSGDIRWTFFTEGPVRFSPAIFEGKVYLASDDGFLYCLGLSGGKLIWKRRVGPEDDVVVGNDRMIGRWPLRSGALVKDGVVYVTAGMWNTDGVYISAFDAETGDEVWQNDTANYIYTIATHGEEGIVNVPPQGYLLENDGSLVVPTGRGEPAGFDLETGRFLWYEVEFGKPHQAGSSWAFVHDGIVFTLDRKCNAGVAPIPYRNSEDEYFLDWVQGLMAWDTRTGDEQMCVADVQRAVVQGNTMFCVNETKLVAVDFGKLRTDCWDMRGVIESDTEQLGANVGWMMKFGIAAAQSKLIALSTTGRTYWETDGPGRVYDLIVAGDKVYLGTKGKLSVYKGQTGEKVFEADLDGRVRGIIAAGNKLFASTDTGKIYCFGQEKVAERVASAKRSEAPLSNKLAQTILASTGIDAGHALLIGTDVSLVSGLVGDSRLAVTCFDNDKPLMLASRESIDAIGLYGTEVAIHHGEFADLPYTDYFANLIVVQRRLDARELKELYRVLRPYGGKAYLACGEVSAEEWKAQLAKAAVPAEEITTIKNAVIVQRGELEGAGSWTHQYGDTRNSYNSGDSIIRAPFKVQWWGGPGPASSVNRHQYGPNPVATKGRFFMTGRHKITCCDTYNGFEYWTFEYPNIGRIGAKLWGGGAITDGDTVFVASGDSCLLLDAETGELRNVLRSPVLKEQYSIKAPKKFYVKGDADTSGRVTVENGPETLNIELLRKDKELVPYDGWELYFDFRPRSKREILYTRGAFRIHIAEEADEKAKAVAEGDTECPEFALESEKTADGSRVSIKFPWSELEELAGEPVSEFSFGFALVTAPCVEEDPRVTPEQVADPRTHRFQRTYRLSESYNVRLTCGLGEFTLGDGGMIGGDGFYESESGDSFTWNYTAFSGGLLFGSASREINFSWHGRPAPNPEDEFIFALDKETGDLKWLIEAKNTFHPSFIGIDDENVYFVDKENFGRMASKGRIGRETDPVLLRAADKFTGKIVWETTDDVFAGKHRLQVADEVLLLTDGGSSITAVSKIDGKIAWHNDGFKNGKPPVIIKDRIYWKPNQFDLATGKMAMSTNPITGEERDWEFHTTGRGGCGEMSGCDNLVFFRDGYLAYHDLVADDGEHWVGGIRPSCTANILPVGGLVVQPEGASGCTCAGYSFQTCIALAPAPQRQEVWTMLKGNAGGLEDIRDLKINFGAPGDRKIGEEWYLAFPRRFRPSYQRLPVFAGDKDVSYMRRNADLTDIQGTDMDWFYGSQAHDIRKLRMDLLFNMPAVATRVAEPMAIDGHPDSRLEGRSNLIQLVDRDKTIYEKAYAAFSYDDDNLYVTLKREAVRKDGEYVEWSGETEGEEALTWKDDSWSIRIKGKGMASFDISVSGGRRVDVYKSLVEENEWNWKSAVSVSPESKAWTTEVAVPWKDLERNVGASKAGCSVYIKGFNRTGVGPDSFEYKYRDQEKHNMDTGTVPLSLGPPPAQKEKLYGLVLHFAELEDVGPGERVFDVLAQGKTIIAGLDIAKEAGGTLKALSKEISGISGRDYLDIDFVPQKGSLPPVLSGLELIKD